MKRVTFRNPIVRGKSIKRKSTASRSRVVSERKVRPQSTKRSTRSKVRSAKHGSKTKPKKRTK